MQLAQIWLQPQRHAVLRGELVSERGTALQRRADQHVPRTGMAYGIMHLLPTTLSQRIVEAAAKAAALLGLAVAQQVDAGRHAD
jgi:hypothetical protein